MKIMETYFASPQRANDIEFKNDIEFITKNPIIKGMMNAQLGLFAILNEHRQILTLNESLLKKLGVSDVKDVLGARPGETIRCIHADVMPGGCGTSEFCSTCGAAKAIVTSIFRQIPVEKECAITIENNGELTDLYLKVRSCPVTFDKHRFYLFSIQDITYHQKLMMLERVFFHDVNNMLSGLVGATQLLAEDHETGDQKLVHLIHETAQRLSKEMEMQKALSLTKLTAYQPVLHEVTVAQIFDEIKNVYSTHPAAKNKLLTIETNMPDLSFTSDSTLLIRVLDNMLINALEATDSGGEVKISAEAPDGYVVFSVWNQKPIPNDISKRIFQRNFSTKSDGGRGLGTYSMKMFGEEILGGKVYFTTSESEGTVFYFRLNER